MLLDFSCLSIPNPKLPCLKLTCRNRARGDYYRPDGLISGHAYAVLDAREVILHNATGLRQCTSILDDVFHPFAMVPMCESLGAPCLFRASGCFFFFLFLSLSLYPSSLSRSLGRARPPDVSCSICLQATMYLVFLLQESTRDSRHSTESQTCKHLFSTWLIMISSSSRGGSSAAVVLVVVVEGVAVVLMLVVFSSSRSTNYYSAAAAAAAAPTPTSPAKTTMTAAAAATTTTTTKYLLLLLRLLGALL